METLLLQEIFKVYINNDSENDLNTINNRVANQTMEVIKNVFKSGQVKAETKVVQESIWNVWLINRSQRNLFWYELQSEAIM